MARTRKRSARKAKTRRATSAKSSKVSRAKSARGGGSAKAKSTRHRTGKARPVRARAISPARIISILFADEVTPNRYDDSAAAAPRKGARRGGMLMQPIRGWRVAESLQRLLAEINAMAPNRSKASDGSIGDALHQTRDSDHNPWVVDGGMGVVTARDFTHDPKNGCDAQAIADAIVASRDPRVKYIIWNRRICSSQVQPWTWRKYSGANPHNKHVHISVLPQKAKYDDVSDWQIAPTRLQGLQGLAMALGVEMPEEIALAWGKKVTPAFKQKVIAISAELGIDPNHLMAAMAFESARTFSADIENKTSKAVGLIQFMPATARALGTSTEALKKMTPVAQLGYVRRYFLPNKNRLRDLSDVYMAILWPRAIARPASYVLFALGSSQYRQNKGLDADNDGVVTKAEAAARVQQHLVEGMRQELRG
jgi:hypothetical protein